MGCPQPAMIHAAYHAASQPGCVPRRRRRGRLAACAGDLPSVDWTRRSVQQVLFVDRTDTVRGRFAVGMFERVASWVGCSRAMQAWPCGVAAEPSTHISWSTQASLFGLADSWRVRPHLFTAARQRFDEDDIDRFELVVCLDSGIQADVLKLLSAARPAEPHTYVHRICCLTDFLMYCTDEELQQQGSRGVLDRQLRGLVRLALPSLRPSVAKVAAAAAATGGAPAGAASGAFGEAGQAVAGPAIAVVPAYMLPTGIQRPELHGSGGCTASRDDEDGSGGEGGGSGSGSERWDVAAQWDRMALLLAVCCAGLVQYMLECRPEDAD